MEEVNKPALKIEELSFKYPGQSTDILKGLSLEVKQGERFGLFGPNGAGKSTLMHLMTGLLAYENGSIQLFGQEIKNHKKSIKKLLGFVPQDFSFYQELSPIENLAFFGAWSNLDKNRLENFQVE
jgi:ABC-2 type transport system ATP-binding protein